MKYNIRIENVYYANFGFKPSKKARNKHGKLLIGWFPKFSARTLKLIKGEK